MKHVIHVSHLTGGGGFGGKRTAQDLKTGYYIRQLDWAPIFAAQDFYFRRFSSQKLEQLIEYQFQSYLQKWVSLAAGNAREDETQLTAAVFSNQNFGEAGNAKLWVFIISWRSEKVIDNLINILS